VGVLYSTWGFSAVQNVLYSTWGFSAVQNVLYSTWGFSAVRPVAAAARGWHQVAQNMHDLNGIIDKRSASPTAPDLVAAISDEGLQGSEQKKVSLKECFSYEYFCFAASFPGTKRICGNPSQFAGITLIFLVIPGNPSEMEFLYQEKVFVAGCVSGNER